MPASSLPMPFNQRLRLRVVQIAAVLSGGMLLVSRPAWNEDFFLHELVEVAGFIMTVLCLIGRLWCILYIGAKKNEELVTIGPYSLSRNPLYFFSTMGATGIGLMFGSILAAAVLGFVSYQIFLYTGRREAEFLQAKFGGAYSSYAHQTPLFWPQLSLYNDVLEGNFSPAALWRTGRDGAYFLMVFPLIELVEFAQREAYLPVLLWLY